MRVLFFLFFCQLIHCQEFTYKGVVKEGEFPLPGAQIVIKGANRGVESDFDGKYSINLKVGDVLEISYIGMKKTTYVIKESDYKNATNINPSNIKVESIENDDYKKNIYIDDTLKPATSSGFMENTLQINPYIKINKNGVSYKQKYLHELTKLNFKYATNVKIGKPIRLYSFQNEYSQGRSIQNNYTYQPPESNEIFSWGSSINNLSISNTTSEFYPNGVIESNILGKKVPIYDRNELFNTTYQILNSLDVDLNFNVYDNLGIKLSNLRFNNTFSQLQNKNTNAEIFFKKRNHNHNFHIHLNYNNFEDKLSNNNFKINKIIYANAITPTHFDSKEQTVLSNGLQRNFTTFYDNPYYLLENNQDNEKSNFLQFFIEDIYNKDRFTHKFSFQSSLNNNLLNIVSNTNNYNIRKEKNYETNLQYRVEWNKNYKLKLGGITQINFQKRDFIREYFSLNNSILHITNQLIRDRKYLFQEFNLRYDLRELLNINNTLNLSLKPSLYYSSTLEKRVAFNIQSSLEYHNLFNFMDISLSNSYQNNEPSLRQNNLSLNTLNQNIKAINTLNNDQELILPNYFTTFTKNYTSLVIEKNYYRFNFDLKLYYDHNKNVFAPILRNIQFFYLPALDYVQKGIEFSAYKNFYIKHNLSTDIQINFEKYENEVTKTLDNQSIAFAGFREINKNYIKGEPIGVIVGTSYLRNNNDEIVIGSDGFPVINENKKNIGNPNPNFIVSLHNSWKYKNWNFSINFQYQNGGQIWDGTQQTLNYFGASQESANERNITNFVFQGVNSNGQVNQIPVNFYDAQLSVDQNKWVRNGFSGVGEDGIVDASYLNINEIALSREFNLSNISKSPFKFKVQLYINNVFLWSKHKQAFANQQLFDGVETTQLNYFNAPLVQTYGFNINFKL